MKPRIETIEPKRLIGMCKSMSRSSDKTSELWRSFLPRRAEVAGRTTTDSISMQVYSDHALQVFDQDQPFVKWAAVEVEEGAPIPEGMEAYSSSGGLYAVFVHNGPATDPSTFRYIFSEWLPSSAYVLDHREHFEVLPADYAPLDPNAREEIFIPVEKRA